MIEAVSDFPCISEVSNMLADACGTPPIVSYAKYIYIPICIPNPYGKGV